MAPPYFTVATGTSLSIPEASITRSGCLAGFSIHARPPRFFMRLLILIISAMPDESMKFRPDMSSTQSRGRYSSSSSSMLRIAPRASWWRKDNTKRAEDAARFDLLLNAVAQAEKISVSEAELASLMRDIAEATGLELENVMAVVEPQPLREQLMRDKARELIVSSAKEATA